ncbi:MULTISPECIES: hypothetical protein [unclassified Campylobacter]|uniref:hypothetical protein n=1 Tax=unclassified Campylobacter TaxID=2593542 RepID=UPI001237D6F7|nr:MULTISPECIES: hypothetical protein [unclassified Campylobacter]KAA6225404.1 hypothetical protein FMM54_06480 [Campylobacter sp. LR185c]KAA6227100.1 hypothetical protein FMM55_03875 [Campylobacter sp. LR196d]KAA6228726.1 hypothetical protein FMM57_02340 [Campylobacter sp. LR286c]KAA6229536.1 hypothetical protein FMM56_08295 [Campylobacter sp. LR264d]KAA6230780.1 hypothetical protein FMM58_05050 [Campylobacter sp. LR291e]
MSYIDYTKYDFELIKKAGKIAYLDCWGDSLCCEAKHLCEEELYKGTLKKVDIYEDLNEIFWQENHAAILFPMNIDQIWLSSYKDKFKEYLDRGGIILNFTASVSDFCPYDSKYIASKTPIRLREVKLNKHPICNGLREYDINYRRGVKGFFNRGYKNPSDEAEIFMQDDEGYCVAYVDRTSSKGVLINTAGADLLAYGLFDLSTARRLGLNVLIYIENILKERLEK